MTFQTFHVMKLFFADLFNKPSSGTRAFGTKTSGIKTVLAFKRHKILLAFLSLFIIGQGYALGQSSISQESLGDEAQLTLSNAGILSSESSPTQGLVLDIALANGWHGYWRSPGAAGSPPLFTYTTSDAPEAKKTAGVRWPAPVFFDTSGIHSAGYKNHVSFPITLALDTPTQTAEKLSVDILICNVQCVPRKAVLDIPAPSDMGIQDYQNALKSVPVSLASTDLSVPLKLSGTEDELRISVKDTSLLGGTPTDKISLFVETGDEQLLPPAHYDKKTNEFIWPLADWGPLSSLAPLTVTAVGAKSLEVAFPSSDPLFGAVAGSTTSQDSNATSSEGKTSLSTLLFFLLLAVGAGLILNIMPCVLPILSIKILSVLENSDKSEKSIRLNFLMSAAGIFTAFFCIAVLLLILKTTGRMVGWGIQFQHPLFTLFLVFVLFLFSCNLFGLWSIRLPNFLTTSGQQDPEKETRLLSHFSAGFFATLLATPCTAPLLAPVLAFALSKSAAIIFLIFGGLGLGLSLPYLLGALYPKALKRLPKPGPWMRWVRPFFGLLLLLTLAWLLYLVFPAQRGWKATALASAALGVGVLALIGKKKSFLFLGIATLAFFVLPLGLTSSATLKGDSNWEPFAMEKIQDSLNKNQKVIVNVSAAWCVTCKVNEIRVLNRTPILTYFKDNNVRMLKGDWTNPDPKIEAYMRHHNQNGIPLTVVYTPKNPKGVVLPPLLTKKAIITALEN